MSLQFIVGGSGSGKSRCLYDQVIDRSICFPKEKIILIVPEQYTMQTQKKIVSLHPNHGVMNVDIVSFERLAHRIFEELGEKHQEILEDTGKSMIIRRILSEHKDELFAFRGNLKKAGFVDQIRSMLSELLQYGISPDMLVEKTGEVGSDAKLYMKLKDICQIYQAFMAFIDQRYMTTEELLDKLAKVIDRSQFIRQSYIYMDNFTGFTPVQYQLMHHLLTLAPQVTIAMTVDTSCHPYEAALKEELFYLTKDTIAQLDAICQAEGVVRTSDILLDGSSGSRFMHSPDLATVEAQLFRPWLRPYKEEVSHIAIYEAADPRTEMQLVAQTIHAYVMKKGYRYEEIAVITSDMERYRRGAQYWFKKYHIPCFFDNRRSITGNMLVEWMRSLLNMLMQRFSYESVFRYLRSGLSGIAREHIDTMEDYVLAFGIRGASRWQKIWTAAGHRIDETQLAVLNTYRQQFIEPLTELIKLSATQTIETGEMIRTIYRYMQHLEIRQQIADRQTAFEAEGDLARAKEYEQIYDVMIGLLEKMYLILGKESLSIREFCDVIETGMADERLGIIPPGRDQVTFGDVRRTRVDQLKILIFAGMNDGLVPMVTSETGLITDIEREKLVDYQLKLAPTAKENTCTERFYIYAALTKPSEQLILTYSSQDAVGHELRSSDIIYQMRRILPQIQVRHYRPDDLLEEQIDVTHGFQYMISGMSELSEGPILSSAWRTVFDWYCNQPDYQATVENLLKASFYCYEEETLSRTAVHAVYGGQLSGGVTMLERYAACAYAHFLTYGLRLREREIYQVRDMDIGMIFHQAIERFSLRIGHSGYGWRDIPDAVRDQMAEDCVKSVTMGYNNSVMHDTKRAEYLTEKITRMTKRTIWALQQQLKKGDFEPAGYELKFTTELASDTMRIVCGEEGQLLLNGKIDRLDYYEEGGRRFIKIVDYKTGSTKFDLDSVYYGLQLQLMVYMNAVCEIERKQQNFFVIPAGILYYHIDDPLIQSSAFDKFMQSPVYTEDLSDEDIAVLEKLGMSGLLVDDPDMIRHMDREPDKKPKVLPISVKKNGELDKRSSAVSEELFGALSGYTNHKVQALSRRIFEGDIAVDPYSFQNRTACDYCNYRSICGFDTGISGYDFRRLRKLEKDTIWEKIMKGDSHGNELD